MDHKQYAVTMIELTKYTLKVCFANDCQIHNKTGFNNSCFKWVKGQQHIMKPVVTPSL